MTPSYPIVFYISGHGFGHAARATEVINRLGHERPDIPLIIRSSVPRRFFQLTLKPSVAIVGIECDTGVVQRDSLTLDQATSVRQAAAFHATLDSRATAEAEFLRASRARLVVGDIPALAPAAAHMAGIPSILIGNFTWDWIYEGYEESAATNLVSEIRRAYATAALALRLPMSGGFQGLEPITQDIPFIARRSRWERSEVRKALGLPIDKPLVLISFGGYGVAGLDTAPLRELTQYTFVTTDTPTRNCWATLADARGFVGLSEQRLYDAGHRYEDLVRAADVIVTKPGYGIIAEAIANDTAVLYTSRGRFVEYAVIVDAMPRYLRCGFIERGDLLAGHWQRPLEAVLAMPPAPEKADITGDLAAARAVAGIYDSRRERA
jgi:L-arabinokinase